MSHLLFLLQPLTLPACSLDASPCMPAIVLDYCTFLGTVLSTVQYLVRLKMFFFSYFCLLGPFICVKIIINLFQYRTMCVCVSHSVMSNSVTPSTVALARLLSPWNSPGKNTRVGTHSLLQGNLPHPDPRMEPRSPALQADSLPTEPPGKWRLG